MKIPTNWSFHNEEIANNFDNHVREQLPWYDLVTNAVVHIGRHYIQDESLVYDIGASNGNIARALTPILKQRNAYIVGIDNSKDMVNNYKSDYSDIRLADALTFDYVQSDLIVCFLTMMFIPPKHRSMLIDRLMESLNKGGALVIVDKCLPVSGYPSIIMSRLALNEKLNSGATPKDIIDKELSLSGVQIPINTCILPENAVEFFRFGDFAGWIIEK
jgi:tRNA (cmo5U34)-methyltransferase